MNSLAIDMTVTIDRPVDEVFSAWTTAAAFASWFAPMAEQVPDVSWDFKVGGKYSIVMPLPDGTVHTTAGIFQEIVENVRIVMTWRCDAFADPESLVEVSFGGRGDRTEVHLRHQSFDEAATRDAHRGGWDMCLAQLEKVLTMRNPK